MPTKKTRTSPTGTTIPYGRQDLNVEEIKAVLKVLKSDFLTQGPLVGKFEQALADYCGARYCVVFSSGTAALHAACHAAGLKAGLHAVTTPMSFVASANCVLYTGALVKFADIDPAHAQITKQTIAPHVDKRTRVIIPVDLAGFPGDVPAIHAFAQKKGIAVIRDATHSMGAQYRHNGRWMRVGSCRHEDFCCFSFHPVKSFTTGEGGAVTTNNAAFYRQMISFRQHGITKDRGVYINRQFADRSWYYEMQELGYNYRLSDIHCALGITQIKRLDEKIKRRTELVERYRRELKGTVDFLEHHDHNARSAHHLLPVLVAPGIRDKLMQRLCAVKINTQLHYIPIYRQPFYQRCFSFSPKNYPCAEKYFKSAMSIPLFPALTDRQQSFVIRKIKEIVGELLGEGE
ncbi:MAG: UDP-4-amino-4,6-dideoxy-N-acetyl-beta-L-altrosamine transaminase [Deltaproteobacteria bacterium]|nr:UDP-4-amino-4,6-dideoxy-N-acetyl-beta-L-altrosamine transaminase [Deltaproteobacteria bacterium]